MEKTIYIHSHSDPHDGIHTPDYKMPEGDDENITDKFSKLLLKLAKVTAVLGIIFLFISFAPSVWYSVKGNSKTISSLLAKTAKKSDISSQPVKPSYQPRFDNTLSKQNRIVIPSIGVDTLIEEAIEDNYEEALKKGVWRVSDFGTPFDRERPTILAAHRYGYLAWSNVFRRKSSFYNLPKLKEGDTVEIIWKQRKYVYEVVKTEKGEEITGYSADLILYTCESLNSSVRIFKYARLLEI